MRPKEIVMAYYNADLANDEGLMERFIHEDCQLNWHSTRGFNSLGYDEINILYLDIRRSYSTFRTKISHLVAEGNIVTTRYTIFVTPVETPDEEIAMAHFITIWEIKDDKLYRGFEISQQADVSTASLNSF